MTGKIDAAKYRADGAAHADKKLSARKADEGKLRCAVQLGAESDARIAELRVERNRLFVTLYVFDRRRGLPQLAGLARTQAHSIRHDMLGGATDEESMRAAAAAAGLTKPTTTEAAIGALVGVAQGIAFHEGVVKRARQVRDTIARKLVKQKGYTQSEVAVLIQRDPSVMVRAMRRREEPLATV